MSEKRDYTFGLRMSHAEKTYFEQAAHKEGLDLTGWVRQVLIKAMRSLLGKV